MSAVRTMFPRGWPGPLAWAALLAAVACCSAVAWGQEAPPGPPSLAELEPYVPAVGGGAGLVSTALAAWVAWPAVRAARQRVAAAVSSWQDKPAPPRPVAVHVDGEDEPTTVSSRPTAVAVAALLEQHATVAAQVADLHAVLGARDPENHGFSFTIRLQRVEDALADTSDAIRQLARLLEQRERDRPPGRRPSGRG